MSPLPRPRPVLRALAGIVLVLVAGEVAIRTWVESPSVAIPDARYDWRYPPHTRIVHSGEGWSVATTNALGFFGPEPRTERPRLRVLLLGDSYAEALQVPRDSGFTAVAERLVPGLEVVNAGVSGRSPADYADWLEEHGAELRPDLVVVQVNDGDLEDLLRPATVARIERGPVRDAVAPAAPHEGRLAALARAVLRRSALANVASKRLRLLAADQRARLSRRFQEATVAAAAAPAMGSDPRLPALMDRLAHRLAAASPRIVYLYIPSVDYFVSPPAYDHPAAAAFWHAFAARDSVTLVDPMPGLRAEFERTGQPLHGFANSVIGSGHINEAGHRVVGAWLARAITEAAR